MSELEKVVLRDTRTGELFEFSVQESAEQFIEDRSF